MASFGDRLRRFFGGASSASEPPKPKMRVDLQIVKGLAWEQDVDWIVVPMDAEGPARIAALKAQGRAYAKIDPPTAEGLGGSYALVLRAAHSNGVPSIAFPPLWAGIPNVDEAAALRQALDAVAAFVSEVPTTCVERVVFAMG